MKEREDQEAELRRRIEELTRAATAGGFPDAECPDGTAAARLAAVAYSLYKRMTAKAFGDDSDVARLGPESLAEAAFFRDLLLLVMSALSATNPLLDAQDGFRLARWCLEEALVLLAGRGYALTVRKEPPDA